VTAATDAGRRTRGRWRWLFLPLLGFWSLGVVLTSLELLDGRGSIDIWLAEDPDRVPRVTRVLGPMPIEVGDRLLEIDGVDQRGTRRFPGTLRRWAQPRGRTSNVEVERGGERLRFEVPLRDGRGFKGPLLVYALAFGICGILVQRRAGTTAFGQLTAPVMLVAGSAFFFPIGGRLETATTFVSNSLLAGVMAPLATWALFHPAPETRPRGLWFRVALAALALRGIVSAGRVFGLPGFGPEIRGVMAYLDPLFLVGMLALMVFATVRVHRALPPDVVRRLRFVGVAFGLGALPTGVVLLLWVSGQLVFPDGMWAVAAMGAFPLALLVADWEYLDTDRIVTGSVATVGLVALALAGALWFLPELVETLAHRTGLGEGPSVVAVTAALVGLGIPLARRTTPTLEAWLFPERAAFRAHVDQLLRDLPTCATPSALATLLRERLDTMLRPRSLALWMRDEVGLVPVAWASAGQPPRLERDSGLARELAVRLEPLSLQSGDPLDRPGLRGGDHRLLTELDPAVLVPVRRAGELAMVWSLGVKRSGDVYTPNDLSLLTVLAEATGARLRSFEEAAILAETRARVAALGEASEEKTRFLATASHDLRQPLNALSLLVASLDDHALDPAVRETVRRIRASTSDLKEMVEGVMDLSKLDAGAEQVSVSAFPLGVLLERLALELRPEAEAAGVALHVPETRLDVASDPLVLRRILQNLLTNAIKYTREGEVRVALREVRDAEPPALWIDVHDTGPGLTPEERERIFAEWRRAERDVEGPVEGLGLGLSIVKRLAGWLDHPLDVDSTPGEGSRFSVRVPIAAGQPALRLEPPDPLAGLHVLVVEADSEQRAALERLLGGWGCRTTAVADASAARAGLAGASPPAVGLFGVGANDVGAALAELDALPVRLPTALLVAATPQRELGTDRVAVRLPLRPARLRAALAHLASRG
jgi:signal transduction histidine kinase